VKAILDGWEARSPGRRQVMFRALMNARPSHLPDPGLFDFAALALRATGAGDDDDLAQMPPILRNAD
jgi:tRNA 2-thiocytidine biosynthesis protein TtcA